MGTKRKNLEGTEGQTNGTGPGDSLDVGMDRLRETDPFLWELMQAEGARQARKLIFIASESICPVSVRMPLASNLGHIYAEGYAAPRMKSLDEEELCGLDEPFVQFKRYSDRRYYKGTDYMNLVESLARRRAAELFANDRVSADSIYANVQPLSGAAANNSVYQGFLKPKDKILGMSLVSGGHLTHGSPVNRSGRMYQVAHYNVGPDGKLDYDAIAKQAKEFQPKIIVAGFSAYPWDIDWQALRQAADGAGSLLMADISHTAGLVATGVLASPVGLADVITFTTHKTICGPRGAVILTTDRALAKKVDMGVFPGEQGGPHMHQIASKAAAFKVAATDSFRTLMANVAKNAAAMAESFRKRGMTLAYGGTNTHLLLLDLRKVKTASGKSVTGEIASRVLDLCGITCNKNTISGDKRVLHPSGLRFGTTWATQRGLGPKELDRVAELVVRVLEGLHSYQYLYAGGSVGRGKVEWGLLKEVRAEVDRITAAADQAEEVDRAIERYPHYLPGPVVEQGSTVIAETADGSAALMDASGRKVVAAYGDEAAEAAALSKAAGLVDLGDCQVVDATGRRVGLFLHSALDADIIGLEAWQAQSGHVLDQDGAVLAEASVTRLDSPDDRRFWKDHFLLRVGPGKDAPDTLEWLRALSDGDLYHDEDIYLKAEGPAALGKARRGDQDLYALSVVGPKAADVWAKMGSKPLDVGAATAFEGGYACRPTGSKNSLDRVDLFLPVDRAAQVWSRLVEAGASPCGRKAYDQVVSSVRVTLADTAAHKPFFVGRKALVAKASGAASSAASFDKNLAASLKPVGDDAWKKALEVEPLPDRTSCLYDEHLKLTAKKNLISFAGWTMPVWYSGIALEHQAVRQAAGLFDVSHMGVLGVRGPYAERFLDLLTSNYVPWLNPGQCHYSYLLDPSGGVIDDIIVYRETRDRFMVVVNASNAEVDEAWLRAVNEGRVPPDPRLPITKMEGKVELINLKLDESQGADRRVDVAFQGPASLSVLLSLISDEDQKRRFAEMERFHMMLCRIGGMDMWVARTGYTGESVAYELFPHPDKAPELWNLILDAGKDYGVIPAGLGARDSTRAEAGLPLHGHELAGPLGINPLEAGYAPFVRLHKPFFVGRDAMLDAYHNRKRRIVRFQATETGGKPIRPPAPVVESRRGECIGTVTSCVSVDKYQIGLAFVDRKKVRVGDHLLIYPGQGKLAGKAPTDLEPGERTGLPIEVQVLRRFMRPGETRKKVLK